MSCPLASGVAFIGRLEVVARRVVRWLVERTPLRTLRDWATAFSLWPVHLTTSCCGAEFGAAYGPRYDLERTGSLPFLSPRNCNLLLIEGTLTKKMARAARVVWEQMPWPKYAIVIGACGIGKGVFYNSYNLVPAHEVVPIDVFVPGCPPRPEGLAAAILKLQEKVRSGRTPSEEPDVDTPQLRELMKPWYEELRSWEAGVLGSE